jgi:hypothetical protein
MEANQVLLLSVTHKYAGLPDFKMSINPSFRNHNYYVHFIYQALPSIILFPLLTNRWKHMVFTLNTPASISCLGREIPTTGLRGFLQPTSNFEFFVAYSLCVHGLQISSICSLSDFRMPHTFAMTVSQTSFKVLRPEHGMWNHRAIFFKRFQ